MGGRTDKPKYQLGDIVQFEVTAEVAGIKLSAIESFTVVGAHMGSSAESRTYSYDLAHRAPEAYYAGSGINFAQVPEAKLSQLMEPSHDR